MGRLTDNTPISGHQAAGTGGETWSEVSREFSLHGYLLQSLPALIDNKLIINLLQVNVKICLRWMYTVTDQKYIKKTNSAN